MSFSAVNPVSVGNATKKDHYDRAFDNTLANKEARSIHPLGGQRNEVITSASFADTNQNEHIEIDGTNLAGHTVEVHAMARVDAGTGQFQLYNVTLVASVASSPTDVTGTSFALVKSAAITLATGVNVYKLQAKKGTTEIQLYGARVVIR